MRDKRKVATCQECRKLGEIAAKDLCYTCYRRISRAVSRLKLERAGFHDPQLSRILSTDSGHVFHERDRHTPGVRREHAKLIKAYASIVGACQVLGIDQAGMDTIRNTVWPHLMPVHAFLQGPSATHSKPNEQDDDDTEWVDIDGDFPHHAVNSEQ